MDRYYPTDNRSRAASAHINTDVFVSATTSVNVVRLWLLMILLANLSTIERQVEIGVRLITMPHSAPVSEAMRVLQETRVWIQDMGCFVYIYGNWA
jgi:hypothetical protein